jgi:hypothetical protein
MRRNGDDLPGAEVGEGERKVVKVMPSQRRGQRAERFLVNMATGAISAVHHNGLGPLPNLPPPPIQS